MLDLDAKRKERAESRRQSEAAGREARGEDFPIVIGGETIAVLGPEFPVTALAPLLEMDDEITLLISKAIEATRKRDDVDEAMEATRVVLDILTAYPNLPLSTVEIVRRVAVNLLGQSGLDAFMAQQPSREDMAALAMGVAEWYGFSLGEASRSSESSTSDGGTSNTTSGGTDGSTPATPSALEVIPAS